MYSIAQLSCFVHSEVMCARVRLTRGAAYLQTRRRDFLDLYIGTVEAGPCPEVVSRPIPGPYICYIYAAR